MMDLLFRNIWEGSDHRDFLPSAHTATLTQSLVSTHPSNILIGNIAIYKTEYVQYGILILSFRLSVQQWGLFGGFVAMR